MIQLPPEFNVALLVSDFVDIALPFVNVALLFAAFTLIKRVLNNGR